MSQRKNFDYLIMLIVVGLVLFGVVMVFSASYYSYQVREGDGLSRFIKQLQGAAIGLALRIILAFVDYQCRGRSYPLGCCPSIAFLVVVLFTEEDILSQAWLDLGLYRSSPRRSPGWRCSYLRGLAFLTAGSHRRDSYESMSAPFRQRRADSYCWKQLRDDRDRSCSSPAGDGGIAAIWR